MAWGQRYQLGAAPPVVAFLQMELALHPDLEPIAFLLGRWHGEGDGEYPTIEPVRYREEVELDHVGKPFLSYRQRTWALDDGRPLHAEVGYLRAAGNGRLELVLAHPTGVVELAVGSVTGRRIELASTFVMSTPTAKEVTALERTVRLDDDGVLRYELRMAAVGVDLAVHLRGELRRA
jgi:hypothetical protein